jgi:hypothetical protein
VAIMTAWDTTQWFTFALRTPADVDRGQVVEVQLELHGLVRRVAEASLTSCSQDTTFQGGATLPAPSPATLWRAGQIMIIRWRDSTVVL